MVFSDLDFLLVFLPAVLLAFVLVRKIGFASWSIYVLILASTIFYIAWSWHYFLLLVGLTVINYVAGELIRRRLSFQKMLLWAAVGVNLFALGYFKYNNFFFQSLSDFSYFTLAQDSTLLRIDVIIPLGMSFYTFQQIAYLFDCSARNVKLINGSYQKYFLFVAFFPQLIAGPIVHYRDLVPQFERLRSKILGPRQMYGCVLFAVGLAKKVLIADPLSPMVATAFSDPSALSMIDAWVGMLAYTFQLYFDFSGYSDMAVGLAALFGLRIPLNFNRPYISGNIREFWRRWHITLSRFLRDYLYIPMGGNRGNSIHIAARVFVTMLLGGLWHGAGWTFVLWGMYHGVLVALHRVWVVLGVRLPYAIAWPFTFFIICLGWVMFRSESISEALIFYKALVGYGNDLGSMAVLPVQIIVAGLLVVFWNERLPWWGKYAPIGALMAGILIFLALSAGGNVSEFLYFRF